MDVIPFIKKNDLWYIDLPELVINNILYNEPTFISERNMIELLETLAKKKLIKMNLEFHYDYINPYDAKLVKAYNTYKCVSIFYKEFEKLLSFPPILDRAMKEKRNSINIFIRIQPTIAK